MEPVKSFAVSEPGEVIHLDVKKLGRITRGAGHRVTGHRQGEQRGLRRQDANGVARGLAGWDAVHVAIDGYSRLAYAEVLPDEPGHTTVGFLKRALAFFAAHGITAQRVHTDNGSNYRSAAFRVACGHAGLRHSRSPAYRPQTNGKAERFIRTMLEGWATARSTAAQQNAPEPLTAGSTATTTADPTPPSADTHQETTSLALTPRSRGTACRSRT